MAKKRITHIVIVIVVIAVIVGASFYFVTRSKDTYQSMQAEITVTYENGQASTYHIFARGLQESMFDFRMEYTTDSQPGHTVIYNKTDGTFYDYNPETQVWKKATGLIVDNVAQLLSPIIDNITASAQTGVQFPVQFPDATYWKWSGTLSAQLNVEIQNEKFSPPTSATIEEITLRADNPHIAVVSNSMYHGDESWKTYFTEQGYDTSDFPIQGGFDRGDIIAVENVDAENVKIGDVIVFDVSDYSLPLWAHRVVAITDMDNEIRFTTKGDANPNVLPIENYIEPNHVRGRVAFVIPKLGYPILWTTGS